MSRKQQENLTPSDKGVLTRNQKSQLEIQGKQSNMADQTELEAATKADIQTVIKMLTDNEAKRKIDTDRQVSFNKQMQQDILEMKTDTYKHY